MNGASVHFDWATGARWWGTAKKAECYHPKHPDEPISYAGWFIWAERHGKKHQQVKCSTPGCPILRWTDAP